MTPTQPEPKCNVTGLATCRGCKYSFAPELFDGGCMIPEDERTEDYKEKHREGAPTWTEKQPDNT